MQSAPVTFPRIQTACMNFSQSHISAFMSLIISHGLNTIYLKVKTRVKILSKVFLCVLLPKTFIAFQKSYMEVFCKCEDWINRLVMITEQNNPALRSSTCHLDISKNFQECFFEIQGNGILLASWFYQRYDLKSSTLFHVTNLSHIPIIERGNKLLSFSLFRVMDGQYFIKRFQTFCSCLMTHSTHQ